MTQQEEQAKAWNDTAMRNCKASKKYATTSKKVAAPVVESTPGDSPQNPIPAPRMHNIPDVLVARRRGRIQG